jgi:Ca2+-binding EF-hand superfamily protein
MLTSKFVAASVVAHGLAGAPAFAQDAMRADADAQFQQFDRSNKGYLIPADVSGQPTVAQRFARFDANKDGRLDRSEFAALIASVK